MSNESDDFISEEVRAARDAVARFMREKVVPQMPRYETEKRLPRDLISEAGDLGMYGSLFPEWVGGTGMGFTTAAAITEEIARQDPRFATSTNQQGGTCPSCIFLAGTEEQMMKYVPNLLRGKSIGMMGLTEPGGGSDPVGNMKTTAKRDGDVYRINGSKMWNTLANECDTGMLFAMTDPSKGARGISAFIVEPKKYPKGFEARPIAMMGLSESFRTNAVFYDDFIVPVENRLGKEGEGFIIAMQALQRGRLNAAARAVGIAQACLDEALFYCNERKVAGKPIGEFQMIQGDLAEIVINIEASRGLLYRAAAIMDAGKPSNRIASVAKHHASVTAKHAADKTQQFFGAYGLAKETRISWLQAYAAVYFCGEGSANVQRVLIAEDALGYKKADRHAGTLSYRDPRTATLPPGVQPFKG